MQRPHVQSTVTIQSQQVNYTSHGPSGSFSYAIKLIPKKKADFSIQKLRGIAGMYKSIEDLKEDNLSACNGEISIDSFGYIELGHGNRGKQQWLSAMMILKICTLSIKVDMRYYCGHNVVMLQGSGRIHQMKKLQNALVVINTWIK